jgi:hypothetical protein
MTDTNADGSVPKKRGRKPRDPNAPKPEPAPKSKFQLAGTASGRLRKLAAKRAEMYKAVDEKLVTKRHNILAEYNEEVLTLLVNGSEVTTEEMEAALKGPVAEPEEPKSPFEENAQG